MTRIKHGIVPHLWYDKEAKQAAEFYCSIFSDSEIKHVTKLRGTPSGDCDVVSFTLMGQPFMAISAGPLFKFNESISFIVYCASQEEIDYYTRKLSAVPASEQCGWVKDKYGLSWQIVPAAMEQMLEDKDQERVDRVTQAVMQMKKLDLTALQHAYDGK